MALWVIETEEATEDLVERIARGWFERPCPPEDGDNCNPDLHTWETAHPFDKEWGRDHVRFVLNELGFVG